MSQTKTPITLALYQSNSIGSMYREPRLVETFEVETEEEAKQELNKKMVNGFYIRRFGDD